MTHWNSQRYLQEGRAQGVAESVLMNAVAVAERILAVNAKVPVLFSLRHIAHETGVPFGFLQGVVDRSAMQEVYRVFRMKKSGVGHSPVRFRYVVVPHPFLMKAQRWIHTAILEHIPNHQCSFAFAKQTKAIDAAAIHVKATWIVKLDVTNFFESILEPAAYAVFGGLGYQPLVAFELARLCTRLRANGNIVQGERTRARLEAAPYGAWEIGHLPQGAPTSPLLANAVARPLDDAMLSLARARGLRYTRYADDITLSTDGKWDRASALESIHATYAILRGHGLWPNLAKTHVSPPGARKVVLGMLVDGPQPRLSREFKERVRTHVHFLKHSGVGPSVHASNRGFDSVLGLQRHVYGLLAYAVSVERAWALEMMYELSTVDWPRFDGLAIRQRGHDGQASADFS